MDDDGLDPEEFEFAQRCLNEGRLEELAVWLQLKSHERAKARAKAVQDLRESP